MRILFLILLLFASCTSSDKSPSRLNLSFNAHPPTLDPRKASDFGSSTLVCMIYEGLTRCVPGGSVELALAQKVEVSQDGTLYTFHLRPAFWTDGKLVTAYDFERSWKEILKTPTPCTFLFYPIKHAESCARGEKGIEEVGIHALDAKTLLVELERPTPYFYSLTAFPSFFPAAEDSSTLSGPFRIEKLVYNREIILKKNLHYWNEKNIFLDEIHISIVPDEMTALQMFEKGDLDWMGSSLSPLPLDALDQLRSQIQYIPSAASTLCTFNTTRFPFQNKHLRKAFSLAIHRKELIEQIAPKVHAETASFLPPVFSGQSFSFYDPALALLHFEKGLEELKIERQELEKLTLYFRSTQGEKQLAQTLQKQWKELFGISIGLTQLDFKTHVQKLQSRDYEIAITSWIAQFEDPVSLLDRFRYADHSKNYPGWEHPLYSASLAQANASQERGKLLAEAEAILVEELPLTPLYHWKSPTLSGPRIKKIATSPCGGILFERFELNAQ